MKRFLVLIIACLSTLGACSAADDADGTIAGPSPEEADATTSTSTTLPVLAAPDRYVPVTGEPAPEAKSMATDVLQAVGTYEVGVAVAGLPDRMAGLADPATVAGATALLDDAVASSIEIVYPQLGGLTDTQASIMLVYRQITLDREGQRTEETRTADVRLVQSPTGWSLSEIASIGLGPPPGSTPLSPAAEAVLSNPAIDLPASARWDIEAGIVDDRVLEVLTRVATVAPVGVTSFKTGHPVNVFGASYVSNHTEGRAVDLWAFDGQPVVLQRAEGSKLQEVVRELIADGAVTELGAPWDVDGPGGPSFANTVHQDHLHLAFDD